MFAAGRAHAIRNESSAEASAYVFTPSDEIERFFRAAAELGGTDGPPDPKDVLALAERHGIEMAGPVPAQYRGSMLFACSPKPIGAGPPRSISSGAPRRAG